MRVLIVDDQTKRYGRLIPKLIDLGMQRKDIEIVSCTNGGRDCMQNTFYDLLILDVLVPLWPESDADVQSSLDLLMEIHEGDALNRPGRVIGITADKSVAESVTEHFSSQTWALIDFSESNDDWITRIVNCIKYIISSKLDPSDPIKFNSIDLAIVCALEKPELEEVLKLPWAWQAPRPINDLVFVHEGLFMSNGQQITVCAVSAARMGMVASALLSAALVTMLRPKLIAMCGICAGVKGKVKIGDVLLADPAWDFQSGKRVRDVDNAKFSVAPHQLPVPAMVRSHVQQLQSDRVALAKIATDFGSDGPGLTNIVIGPVASGSAVLADGKVVEEIKLQHRELIGIEMEVYGVYAAAHASQSPQPASFALKAVCDFADPDKEDSNQRYAAYASARVLQLLMERYGSRLLA